MTDILQAYKKADCKLPDRIIRWHLYGAGMENFGRDQKPEEFPLPKYGPDELLVRIDAVGICFSDIKVINQGSQHPRLVGRDLENDPVTLGHEPSITIVGVGENLADKLQIGQRFIVQADVFYQGKSMAFGYVLPGAQAQYQVITKELLEGDEGCYLISTSDSTGYAEAALAEAGSCVLASYRITRRPSIKPGGALWIIGACRDDGDYSLDMTEDPRVVVATGLKWPIMDQLKFWSEAGRFELHKTEKFESVDLADLATLFGGFDDIIVLGSKPEVIEEASQLLNKHGIMNIVSNKPMSEPVNIDVGKVHYQNHSYIGTTSRHIGEAYEPIRMPSELKPGGIAWFIGAGGPMGQIHVQYALTMENGPSKILATDIDNSRLESLKKLFGSTANNKGIEFHIVNPTETVEDFDDIVAKLTDGRGFDDIVVLAPVPMLIEQAVPYLAEQGLMNIFAGVPIGTIAKLDLTGVYMKQIRFVGSSGSRITDMKDTIEATESGKLATNILVAAIGGIEASWDGMLAVKEGKFPGKIVIYPQIQGLELTAIPDLKERLPNVYAKLTDGMYWNNDAEEELLKTMLNLGGNDE